MLASEGGAQFRNRESTLTRYSCIGAVFVQRSASKSNAHLDHLEFFISLNHLQIMVSSIALKGSSGIHAQERSSTTIASEAVPCRSRSRTRSDMLENIVIVRIVRWAQDHLIDVTIGRLSIHNVSAECQSCHGF